MLNVSAEWQQATKAQFRYQAYLYVTLELTPPGLRENTDISTTGDFRSSDPAVIMNASKKQPGYFGTFEPNRICLDGSCNLLTDTTVTDDWWSQLVPSEDSPVVVTFNFNGIYTIPGIYVNWDKETHSWPTRVTLKGYNNSGELVYTVPINNINSVTGYFDAPMTDVARVELYIYQWSTPSWRARIDEIMFGLYVSFDSVNNGRITGATQISKSDPMASKLPTHTMSITLRNLDKYFDPTLQEGVVQYIAQRQDIKASWQFVLSPGNVETSPEMTYIINKFTVPEDSKDVTFELDSRLGLLTDEFKKNTYTGASRTLYDLALYVLQNSNVTTSRDSSTPWVLPESLKNFTTLAPIPATASNVVLQYIAGASMMWLTTDLATGFIKFLDNSTKTTNDSELSLSQELGDPSINVRDQLRSIAFGVYHYSAAGTSEQVGKFSGQLKGTQILEIKYDKAFATSVSARITGATIKSSTFYASYAIIEVAAATTGANVTITLTGIELVQSVSYVQTYRDVNVADGIDVVVENPFITDSSRLAELTTFVQRYYQKRLTYKAPYTGYPELEPGDLVGIKTIYGEGNYEVTNNTIKFNGGWSGTMEVI